MSSSLVPCSACHRHVRSTEGACPFCGARRGLVDPKRAAAVLLAGVAGVVGCGDATPEPNVPAASASGPATAVASAPPAPTAAPTATPTQTAEPAPTAEPRPVAEYGMPRPARPKYGMPPP